ncbi:hypothetical protein O6H91_19G005600 [Diphasiastrum complanatum]|uniref:Uncharacterized protein n=1 Tax=Diphasiastrum complanatum TaxID=34168 RepID=A0ACC2AT50_DIPCM|nr:hypothetical protein O6H91_19G005600 [Diphasiastrum complanatum]
MYLYLRVDERILAETEKHKRQMSRKRKSEIQTALPSEIDELKGTLGIWPPKAGVVSAGIDLDSSNYEAQTTLKEDVQDPLLSVQPFIFENILVEDTKCPDETPHDVSVGVGGSEKESIPGEQLFSGCNDVEKEHYCGAFPRDERSLMHDDHFVVSLNAERTSKGMQADGGKIRIGANAEEARDLESTADQKTVRPIDSPNYGKWSQEEMENISLDIRDHGSMGEIKLSMFAPEKANLTLLEVSKIDLEAVMKNKNLHSDTVVKAQTMEENSSGDCELMAMRLLHVDSAARLSDSTDLSSPLWFKSTTWTAMGTNPFSDGSLSAGNTLEKFLNLETVCIEKGSTFDGLITPCSDLDDDVSNYSAEEETPDLEDLQRICAMLSLDPDLLVNASPTDKHICHKGQIQLASDEKKPMGGQTKASGSRFLTNVAQIQVPKSSADLEAIDAWIHHFSTLQNEPFRLAVLLMAKASVEKSLLSGAGDAHLAFPAIARAYLNSKPPS